MIHPVSGLRQVSNLHLPVVFVVWPGLSRCSHQPLLHRDLFLQETAATLLLGRRQRRCAHVHTHTTQTQITGQKSSANLPTVATLSCDWKPIISEFRPVLYCACNIVPLQNVIHYVLDQDDFWGRLRGIRTLKLQNLIPNPILLFSGELVLSYRPKCFS